jgi:hypothetical protein
MKRTRKIILGLLLFVHCALCALAGETNSMSVPVLVAGQNATVLKNEKLFRGIGVNYFDCFLRNLQNPPDTSYAAGFAILASNGIPFARFCAGGQWPKDMRLYQTNRAEYFRQLDTVVNAAARHGVGLIPSFFWNYSCVPDLVGEPMDQWGKVQSKTRAWMREYVREVVTRYRDNSVIWAWEFGNEFSLQACLPNAAEHRPHVDPTLGIATSRTSRDDLTFEMIDAAFADFAKVVRTYDSQRLIFTGDSFPRNSAWHQQHENNWTKDSTEQYGEMLVSANPDPISGISLHAYEVEDEQRLTQAMAISRKLNKPVFVGEFGVPGDTIAAKLNFYKLLKSIEDNEISLAALWVFDFGTQPNYNVTTETGRSWQLEAIAEANKKLQNAAAKSKHR